MFHANGDQKKSGVAILTSDKTDFEIKAMRQRRTLHSDQRINPRRDITIINIYVPNIGAPQYVR